MYKDLKMFNLELVINSLTQLKFNECQMRNSLENRIPENYQDLFYILNSLLREKENTYFHVVLAICIKYFGKTNWVPNQSQTGWS